MPTTSKHERPARPHAAEAALLRRAGELLLGHHWQRPLARLLGAFDPRGAQPVGERFLRRCAAGSRQVPAWWWPALAQLVRAKSVPTTAQGERSAVLEQLQAGQKEVAP